MVEKNFVAINFKLAYGGPFSLLDFYAMVDKWAEEHHYNKEIKEHLEHQKHEGKELRYAIELWKHVNTQVIAIVRVQLQVARLKDVTITSGKRKGRVQHGDLVVTIDSLLERHKLHAWENKPYIFFMRGIIDRFIKKNLFDTDAGPLASDTRGFYDRTRSFFSNEETRYIS